MRCEAANWIQVAEDRDEWHAIVKRIKKGQWN